MNTAGADVKNNVIAQKFILMNHFLSLHIENAAHRTAFYCYTCVSCLVIVLILASLVCNTAAGFAG